MQREAMLSEVDQMAAAIADLRQRLTAIEALGHSHGDGVGNNPTGTIIATIASTPASGYLAMGTSVANADTAHPDLWAMAPATWKSGTTLNLPSMDDRTVYGGGTLGATGGGTATIASANLPTHTHDINHNHGTIATGTESATHTHGMAHTHTTDNPGNHTHEERYITTVSANAGTYSMMRPYGWSGTSQQGPGAGGHTHTTNSQSTSTTGNASVTHTHNLTIPALGVTASGNGGFANTPLTITPGHVRVNFHIKT